MRPPFKKILRGTAQVIYTLGVAVMVFYQVGEMLQDHAVNRSLRAISRLMDIRPDFARLVRGSATEKVAPDLVKTGELIMVQPGERIPLDGIVQAGKSVLDLSALSGEALPLLPLENYKACKFQIRANINANNELSS